MKIDELPIDECLVVGIVSKDKIAEGEQVLVGVPCIIKDGKPVPLSKRFQLIPNIFDDVKGDKLILLKRNKNESNL